MKSPDIPLVLPSTELRSEARFFTARNMPSITLAGSLALALAGGVAISVFEHPSPDSSTTTQKLEQELSQKALAAIQSGPLENSIVYGNYRINPGDSPYQTILKAKNALQPTVNTARLAGYIAIETSARELIKLRDGGSDIDTIILFSSDIDNDGKDEVLAKSANVTNLITTIR